MSVFASIADQYHPSLDVPDNVERPLKDNMAHKERLENSLLIRMTRFYAVSA